LANDLIDDFQARGECEFMTEFAEPFSAKVITGLLGLDEDLWPKVADFATKLGYVFSVTIKEDLEVIEEGLLGILDIARDLIQSRRGNERDDFVGTLVKASVDGQKITEEELLSLISLMIFAGFDTTRNQIGLGMQTFSEHPDQWQLLGSTPDLSRAAVEEVMRIRPTTTWVTREAAENCDIDGIHVPKGTTIHLFTDSSGTDPRAVDSPEFDITNDTRPKHFGFGGGRHYCLGHFIARGDMTEALALLAQHLQDDLGLLARHTLVEHLHARAFQSQAQVLRHRAGAGGQVQAAKSERVRATQAKAAAGQDAKRGQHGKTGKEVAALHHGSLR
jgi:cytochrome P450